MDQEIAAVDWTRTGIVTDTLLAIIGLLAGLILWQIRRDKLNNDRDRVEVFKRLHKSDKKHMKHDRKFVDVQNEIKSIVMVLEDKKRGRG